MRAKPMMNAQVRHRSFSQITWQSVTPIAASHAPRACALSAVSFHGQ